MSRANLDLFEADLSASLSNLQRILNFYLLKNLASNELFLLILFFHSFYYTKFFILPLFYF
ncbi:hypothetical protein EII27_04980 [Fusobacterium canifelinum]|uniref:Riboflavin synthase subunit alpha n=1 Tax=Fusobacterium canifelinum TaxID=285729 RepID=A0A3P1UYQ2_9FUSO|nr:hypothetical protein EII27_04980 [Fusobacterium canifelinum]